MKWENSTITAWNNNSRGAGYQAAYGAAAGLVGGGWQSEETYPDTTDRARPDFFHPDAVEQVECKFSLAFVRINERQLNNYLAHLRRLGGGRLTYAIGVLPVEEPEKTKAADQLKKIEKANGQIRKLNEDRVKAGEAPYPLVEVRYWPAEAVPVRALPEAEVDPPDGAGGVAVGAEPPPVVPPPPGALNATGQHQAESAVTEAMTGSPDSPEDAAETAKTIEEAARDLGYANAEDADLTQEPLGGVDFSTLELRYVSDTYDGGVGTGVQYAYQVDAKPGVAVSYGGRESAQLAADSFFTWLVLPPQSFTVNLNPDEPNRIIDARLGRTDAGRVLLEADLQMKKTVGKLIHPDTARGRAFWDNLRGETSCISMRQWITPRPAVVRENGNELFILDAPLEVKMETEYFKTEGAATSANCPGQATRDTEHNEVVYRQRILPELEKAVNTAPEYADLRRVYVSRVAAEWYRQRSETKTTAYGELVDSGDASAWPSRVPWDPKEVFDRFVKSYKDGEFRVERTTREGNRVLTQLYVYGGVDFTNIPKDLLSGAEFANDRPTLDTTVRDALVKPTTEAGKGAMWLGGRSTERPLSSPHPMPGSPLGNPLFYVLAVLPVLTWLTIGGYLLIRRRTRPAATPSAGPAPTTPAGQ
ncbi:hypothetical protein [Micromonospora polyrhachis]|uniref:Uncharacterized protein n=1 Tax=Micromonospora polyrhachis TaxID=1282883 RepID=A0A7W7SUJ7_9ACTN|nr:hypothetical protein [Micromonospora polyrhachis]MBB4961255.1 hypothetical protein [Micromonospora polyrhachis]